MIAVSAVGLVLLAAYWWGELVDKHQCPDIEGRE